MKIRTCRNVKTSEQHVTCKFVSTCLCEERGLLTSPKSLQAPPGEEAFSRSAGMRNPETPQHSSKMFPPASLRFFFLDSPSSAGSGARTTLHREDIIFIEDAFSSFASILSRFPLPQGGWRNPAKSVVRILRSLQTQKTWCFLPSRASCRVCATFWLISLSFFFWVRIQSLECRLNRVETS